LVQFALVPNVSYSGHLWTNQWWSQGDTPGGGKITLLNAVLTSYSSPAAGVWLDKGTCSSSPLVNSRFFRIQSL